MITHKLDSANDGPEVDIIRFFRAFPDGAPWMSDRRNPMDLFKQARSLHDIRTAKSSRKKRVVTRS
jgi:hypothetical protein